MCGASIIIGGDLVPTKSNVEIFSKGDVKTLIGAELIDLLNKSNARVFNLEVPLVDTGNPILKCGPCLSAPRKTIEAIKKLEPTILALANNHILDHGYEGLKSTIDLLNDKCIGYIGAGENLVEASKATILEINEIKVGVYACAEHEFSIATDSTSGANPFDPLESLDHILQLKEQCDYVIVLYHGGKEYYRYPSPNLQKVCRKIVEKGADVVLCQHSHCIGCKEDYKNGVIVYGQGNFLFDNSDSDFCKTGLLVKINFESLLSIEYIPIVKNENKVRLANDQEKNQILMDFEDRSEKILKEGFVQVEYDKFSREIIKGYESSLLGDTFIIRVINKLTNYKFSSYLRSKRNIVWLQNMIECEAHHELFLNGLKLNVKKNTK
jgi:poly-gamma-glutamate capsule biosynthesis protein CapA/YwtB (metallophosphatase superfamily)